MSTLRIGAGAGYANDLVEPAEELAELASLDYLVFECLAERTLALAQRRRLRDDGPGYNPLLRERMERILPRCAENDTTVVTNMGAADPEAAAAETARIARELGLDDLAVASVAGSDARDVIEAGDHETLDGEPVAEYLDALVSANAYLGVEGVVEALAGGADVVLTDRVSDVSLFLAPMVHEFGWELDPLSDSVAVGQGIAGAHLIECAGQVTGGYFADPGYKDVDDLAELGFPFVEIDEAGGLVVTKPEGTGGSVTERTCTEQLLYEVHDPAAYITPDAVADFSAITLDQIGEDRVAVAGARARQRTETLKVSVCYEDSFIGEGEISYGGPGAVERGELAAELVRARLDRRGVAYRELRSDLIGADSLHGRAGRDGREPYEVRLRVAGRCDTEAAAAEVSREVERLYNNGPAGGGGATRNTREIIGIVSALVDRDRIHHEVRLAGGEAA